jgi:hypothetical protein
MRIINLFNIKLSFLINGDNINSKKTNAKLNGKIS